MNPNCVICAIDVNDYDPRVIEVAIEFAKHYAVDLELIHVSVFPDSTTSRWPAYAGASSQLDEDHRKLCLLAESIESVDAHTHHLSGIPSDELIGFVERNPPRLLVLGTHGRKGMQRIFGSVASKVLRTVDCPVLVLRQKQTTSQTAETIRLN